MKNGKNLPVLSLVTQSMGVEELWGSVVPEGSRPPAPSSCSRIKDADQKTLHMRAVVGDSHADNWCAGEHLGPPCTGTHVPPTTGSF